MGRFSLGSKVLLNKDTWMDDRFCLLPEDSRVLWENTEGGERAGSGRSAVGSDYILLHHYSNRPGSWEGSFTKKFLKLKLWLNWELLFGFGPFDCECQFYEATYRESSSFRLWWGQRAAVFPAFLRIRSFRLIGNSTGAESEKSFLLVAGTFHLWASSGSRGVARVPQ